MMIGLVVYVFAFVGVLGLCALAAVQDFKGFRIPNVIPAAIVGLFVFAFGVTSITGQSSEAFSPFLSHLMAGFIVLALTGGMYAAKLLGAGDSKFATAVALWTGLSGFAAFMFYMAVAGGLLGGAALLMRKYKPFKTVPEGSFLDKAQRGENAVPYGIAITFGAYVGFAFAGYFDPEKLRLIAGL
jgi:prepilin peptidase CpaA